MGLRLTPEHWRTIVEHLSAALPEEACGLLGGEGGQVRMVVPVENALHSPVAYQMAPVAQIEAMIAIEEAGLELSGIYHSHPQGPPRPSPSDIAQAYYPESVYVICAPDEAGRWQGRAFRIEGGRVAETALGIEYPAGPTRVN
jgi:proteasome lid subunit RPN8/RPN11